MKVLKDCQLCSTLYQALIIGVLNTGLGDPARTLSFYISFLILSFKQDLPLGALDQIVSKHYGYCSE
jgi:hypothetical protein